MHEGYSGAEETNGVLFRAEHGIAEYSAVQMGMHGIDLGAAVAVEADNVDEVGSVF